MVHAAILFDLDGTLLDTLDDLADSMNAALVSLGFPGHPRNAYRYFVGDGVENLVRRTVPRAALADQALVQTAVARMRKEYGERWHAKTRPYPGITDLLAAAAQGGVQCAILSNKPHPAVLEVVAHFFPGGPFQAVFGARPGVPIKPDAGAALDVARSLAVEPSRFLYLGDTNTDMLTAVAAGMYPVGALWGFRDAEELRGAGAQVLAEHPRDVIPLL